MTRFGMESPQPQAWPLCGHDLAVVNDPWTSRRRVMQEGYSSVRTPSASARSRLEGRMPEPVRHRVVFHFVGYDPMPPETYHRRFVRELARFRTTWGLDAAASSPAPAHGGDAIAWRVEASGPNWRVDTDHILFAWNDVVAAANRRPD